ncbi:uncharacterized protein [Medicago truncatula]|uniref:uncharacterized protein n=1 Tax=Medicago truncatula TaxID=3880 RepID=UPI000D2F37EB|nr:uncharacterized protein LOC112422587 [Medicago truncatula]
MASPFPFQVTLTLQFSVDPTIFCGMALLSFACYKESKSFLISIGESRRSFKPKAHNWSFDEVRLKEHSRVEDKQKSGKTRYQAMRQFPFSRKCGTNSCPRWRKC